MSIHAGGAESDWSLGMEGFWNDGHWHPGYSYPNPVVVVAPYGCPAGKQIQFGSEATELVPERIIVFKL
jgi:hypothetical protein